MIQELYNREITAILRTLGFFLTQYRLKYAHKQYTKIEDINSKRTTKELSQMNIAINVEKESNYSIVHVTGKIDATTSDELEDVLVDLLENGEQNIILDLENTKYISSAGLRVLVAITKQVYDTGHFCLCNANDNVQEIIDMAGFNVFMNIYDNLSTAREKILTD